MNKYIYLISIVVLIVPVLLDELIIGNKKLRPFWKILILLATIGLLFGLTEHLALKWVIWTFDPKLNTEIYLFGSHIETYLINLAVFPAIGAATLLLIGAQHKVINRKR
jgi:lycopene cyclase domain-containing protein